MIDANEDTEWNDVLRKHGILPPKIEVKKQGYQLPQEKKSIEERFQNKSLNELAEFEDEEDEEEFEAYKLKRMRELKEKEKREKFGQILQITAQQFIEEVSNAGPSIWVVLHLFKDGIENSQLVNQRLEQLAQKFPETKFLKIISTDCIPNYPDRNLPTIFVYYENDLKKQFIGLTSLGGNDLTTDDVEWELAKVGAVKTNIKENPIEKRWVEQLEKALSGAYKGQ
eukprot:TRINITY_DN545_c0_g3_i1.p1 TRINITY_DN545_c0_g3~~TRINITY_DN545_c0_g3_i1.p1  ORF type:complete len:235 (+),score=125.46 TRINITY_DN545_c0_g3_i1:29-706(+)